MSGNAEPYTKEEPSGLEAVREHRKELEDLAKTDLPAAWIAETLLRAADDADGRS